VHSIRLFLAGHASHTANADALTIAAGSPVQVLYTTCSVHIKKTLGPKSIKNSK
jgi:hypothetical protein